MSVCKFNHRRGYYMYTKMFFHSRLILQFKYIGMHNKIIKREEHLSCSPYPKHAALLHASESNSISLLIIKMKKLWVIFKGFQHSQFNCNYAYVTKTNCHGLVCSQFQTYQVAYITTVFLNNHFISSCMSTLPVGTCIAELGIVAASCGTVLVSGSGVLVVGEVGAGFSDIRGFLCKESYSYILRKKYNGQ